jgi:hypothetical protein
MKRLTEELPEGFEATLLRAGQGGEPPPDRQRRALEAALGVVAASSAAPLALKAGVAAATKPSGVVGAAVALGWKAVAVTAVAVVASAAAATYVWNGPSAAPKSTVALPAPPMSPPTAAPARAVDDPPHAPVAAPRVAAPPSAPSAATVARAVAGPPSDPAAEVSAAEISALDDARTAVESRRPADAVRALDAYDARFPHGSLAKEAALVRIQALVDLGDRPEALRRARELTAAPNSDGLYRARLRRILGSDAVP